MRASVIAEWRGLPEKLPRLDQFQSTSALLPRIMQKLGLKERLHENEVQQAWTEIVGEFIAAHSAPVSLKDGVLYVRVLQPTLHYQFETISKGDILGKLKQRFGARTIRDVRFRVG